MTAAALYTQIPLGRPPEGVPFQTRVFRQKKKTVGRYKDRYARCPPILGCTSLARSTPWPEYTLPPTEGRAVKGQLFSALPGRAGAPPSTISVSRSMPQELPVDPDLGLHMSFQLCRKNTPGRGTQTQRRHGRRHGIRSDIRKVYAEEWQRGEGESVTIRASNLPSRHGISQAT